MNSIAFWKTWHPAYRRPFWIFAAFVIIALSFLWVSNFRAPEPVFVTEHLQELEPLEVPVHTFSKGTTTLTVFSQAYLVFEKVLGSSLHPNFTAAFIFLCLLAVGIVFLFTILTTLKRFWFFVGLVILILLMAGMGLDSIPLFGMKGNISMFVILAVFATLSYYFGFIRTVYSFTVRLAAFSALMTAVGICIYVTQGATNPFYYIANHAIIPGIVISLFFVFTVAHEIVASFVNAVSMATRRTKTLQHFLIITTIYLVNLALIYADKKYLISWKFFPVSLVLLITISGVLGIWGFRSREYQYASILKADPFGTYLILALAGLSFGTIGFIIATANDPAFQLVQDAILYGHIGYGLIFLIYIIANFVSLLGRNMEVHKVLYEPTTMPYFTFRLAGAIATFAFFAYSNWQVSVDMAYAGYYNSMGDYHYSRDTVTAETFYKRSVYYATRNYHAHYALADIYGFRDDTEKQKNEYSRIGTSRPLDLAYINLSQLHENDHAFPQAYKTLTDGLQDFPDNGLLQNALSVLSDEMNKGDTALLLAKAARNSNSSKREAETNLVALSAKYRVQFAADSLEGILNSSHPGVVANLFAMAIGQRIELAQPVVEDTTLSIYSAITLNNFLLDHLSKVDTVWTVKAEQLARKPGNAFYRDYLLAAVAQSYYSNGQTGKAFPLLREVAFATQEGVHYNTLGQWYIEQGVPENALRSFDESTRLRLNIPLNRAVALTEAGMLDSAAAEWTLLTRSLNPELATQATRMVKVLTSTVQQALSFDDLGKYEYARHYFSQGQEGEFMLFLGAINDVKIRTRAVIDYCKKLDEADEIDAAIRVAGNLNDDELLHLQLRWLARKQQWPLLAEGLNKGVTFDGEFAQEKIYYDALMAEHSGKTEEALKIYSWLMSANPFFEDAIVAASGFLNRNEQLRLATYSRLVRAMDINPNSIKLLKAHVLQSAALGYMESAQTSMDLLKQMMPPDSFRKFLTENPDVFRVK